MTGGYFTLLVVLGLSGLRLSAQSSSLLSFERFSRIVTELSASAALPFNPAAYNCMGPFEGPDDCTPSTPLPLPWRVVPYEGPPVEGAVAEGDAGGEALATVTLQGQVWDMATGEVLPAVALEVYQKQSDGRITLAYTGRVATGSFAIPLIRGVTHILIFSCTGYQPEAFYVAAGSENTERSFYLKRRPLASETAVASTSVVETGRPFQDKSSLPAEEKPVIGSRNLLYLLPELAYLEPMCDPPVEKPAPALFVAELKESTSLRQGPSHETEVLLRFQSGDEVEILEKTDEFWWKARFEEQEGYVKAFLLRTL